MARRACCARRLVGYHRSGRPRRSIPADELTRLRQVLSTQRDTPARHRSRPRDRQAYRRGPRGRVELAKRRGRRHNGAGDAGDGDCTGMSKTHSRRRRRPRPGACPVRQPDVFRFDVDWVDDGEEALNRVRSKVQTSCCSTSCCPGATVSACAVSSARRTHAGDHADRTRPESRQGEGPFLSAPTTTSQTVRLRRVAGAYSRRVATMRDAAPHASRLVRRPSISWRSATRNRVDLRLSRREFDILGYLAEREGRIVQRDELLREIWGYPDEPATRAVDYAIRRLRRKLELDPHNRSTSIRSMGTATR